MPEGGILIDVVFAHDVRCSSRTASDSPPLERDLDVVKSSQSRT